MLYQLFKFQCRHVSAIASKLKQIGVLASHTPNVLTDESSYGAYAGFDPTAPDLHIGHLAILSVLKLFAKRGHPIYLIVGDTTAKIGDPSFRSLMRAPKHDAEKIASKFEENLRKTFEKMIPSSTNFSVLRNSKWHSKVRTIDLLERIGRFVKVSDLIKRESVQERMKNGMSYAELSYTLMQAYDFLHLFEKYNCRLQIGGSDQWGNITSGTEIINSLHGKESSLGMTISLLSSKDGNKMGKSAGNAVWVTGPHSSPIFILNALKDISLTHKLFEFAFPSQNSNKTIIELLYGESIYEDCDELMSRQHSISVNRKFKRIFSNSEVIEESRNIKVIELLKNLYSGQKSSSALRELVMAGKISIGSVVPRNPLVRLKEIVGRDAYIVKEREDIKGLYIADLDAENNSNPNSTAGLDL